MSELRALLRCVDEDQAGQKLEADVFLHHVLLKDLRGFVVELLGFGLEPAGF